MCGQHHAARSGGIVARDHILKIHGSVATTDHLPILDGHGCAKAFKFCLHPSQAVDMRGRARDARAEAQLLLDVAEC
jgi:hypothetical protein